MLICFFSFSMFSLTLYVPRTLRENWLAVLGWVETIFLTNLTNRPCHEIVIPELVGSIWWYWDFVWPISHLTNHVMFPDERLLDHIWPNLFDYWDIAGVRRFCWARSPGGPSSSFRFHRINILQNWNFPNPGEVFELAIKNIKALCLFNKRMKNSWEIFEVFLGAESDPKLMRSLIT